MQFSSFFPTATYSSWKNIILLTFSFFLISATGGDDPQYVESIKTWHQKREEALKKEDGLLNLAGLYWLEKGSNTFGGARNNAIVFPKNKCADYLGKLILENGEVWVESPLEANVWQGEQKVEKTKIFGAGLKEPVMLKHQSLRWFIIKRGDKIGVRLRDLESPALLSFKGLETYPVDGKWKVVAKLETTTTERKIPIVDVLGQTTLQTSPGTLVFKFKGKTLRLDAVESEDKLFILFADKTNEKYTYPSGRFLYADKPDASGNTILDFNQSINPPCAFTEFATCPLPPEQNKLQLAITAGEKRFGDHE